MSFPPAEPATVSLRGRISKAAHKFRRGEAHPSRLSRKAALVLPCVLLGVAGCGGENGTAEGATVTVYASAPTCSGAKRVLMRRGGRAGDVQIRVICLPSAEDGGKLNLAAIGANARRATEDSTAVGYIAEPDPVASRFSRPILESAGIAQLSGPSGRTAMAKLLGAIREAGSSESLRKSVRDSLGA